MNEIKDDSNVWELRKGDVVIGTLDVHDQDMFWFTAHFTPTSEFEHYRSIFSEGRSFVSKSNNLEWAKWYDKINSFGMHMIRLHNQDTVSEFILYINDDEADFRPHFDKLR